mmetsp:Transcript_20014/g.39679  ORF Transcript_20014/g.39679 Transcript_20014/m.39679 type:complete len:351 (-) Transcript_20014:2258-3310(-)
MQRRQVRTRQTHRGGGRHSQKEIGSPSRKRRRRLFDLSYAIVPTRKSIALLFHRHFHPLQIPILRTLRRRTRRRRPPPLRPHHRPRLFRQRSPPNGQIILGKCQGKLRFEHLLQFGCASPSGLGGERADHVDCLLSKEGIGLLRLRAGGGQGRSQLRNTRRKRNHRRCPLQRSRQRRAIGPRRLGRRNLPPRLGIRRRHPTRRIPTQPKPTRRNANERNHPRRPPPPKQNLPRLPPIPETHPPRTQRIRQTPPRRLSRSHPGRHSGHTQGVLSHPRRLARRGLESHDRLESRQLHPRQDEGPGGWHHRKPRGTSRHSRDGMRSLALGGGTIRGGFAKGVSEVVRSMREFE